MEDSFDHGTGADGPISPIKLGFANCYLVKTGDSYILIDTGYPRKRKDLEKGLENAGCKPGKLKLVIATHQDFDHTGNCAYIREKYGPKIAMHAEDSEAVERGDMLWNRKARNIFTRIIFKVLLVVFRMGRFVKFKPDQYLGEGDDLSTFGVKAKVLHLPGHSKGSIGILMDDGDLFCGDLFMNSKKSSLVDSQEDLDASIERLREFNVRTIYPGHGDPFTMDDFLNRNQSKA
ncbi:MAG: MBL fold metallo-hydrolase [Candidatus Odinarchaeota archaeon]